jgi:SAM-dependent methyltransferase
MSKTRIENEIEHGKYLAGLDNGDFWYWTSPAGQERLKRRQQVYAAQVSAGMNVLELGCGSGDFTKTLAETKARITAVDISSNLIECARKKVPDANVTFKVENAYDLNYPDHTFDAVIGNSILHHLEMDQAFKEIRRVLKPGKGICFIEPNLLNPLQIIELSTPYMRKISRHSPDETAIVRWKMKNMLEAHGFENVRVAPFDFLHPNTPKGLIPLVKKLGYIAEKTPLLREISGSLLITANRA